MRRRTYGYIPGAYHVDSNLSISFEFGNWIFSDLARAPRSKRLDDAPCRYLFKRYTNLKASTGISPIDVAFWHI